MPIRDLKAQIARLPEQPGVYLYYNEGRRAMRPLRSVIGMDYTGRFGRLSNLEL